MKKAVIIALLGLFCFASLTWGQQEHIDDLEGGDGFWWKSPPYSPSGITLEPYKIITMETIEKKTAFTEIYLYTNANPDYRPFNLFFRPSATLFGFYKNEKYCYQLVEYQSTLLFLIFDTLTTMFSEKFGPPHYTAPRLRIWNGKTVCVIIGWAEATRGIEPTPNTAYVIMLYKPLTRAALANWMLGNYSVDKAHFFRTPDLPVPKEELRKIKKETLKALLF